jgi:hypothetical protein
MLLNIRLGVKSAQANPLFLKLLRAVLVLVLFPVFNTLASMDKPSQGAFHLGMT